MKKTLLLDLLLLFSCCSVFAQNTKKCADGSVDYGWSIYVTGDSTHTSIYNYYEVCASDPTISDADQYGYFSDYRYVIGTGSDPDSLIFNFHHPKYINSNGAFQTMTYIAYDKTTSSPAVNFIYHNNVMDFYRRPVLMLHGLWSNGEKAFGSLKTYLTSYYPSYMLLNPCYPNDVSLEQNQMVVYNAINELLTNARNNGIFTDKVDIVAHSMGGLVARYYIQSGFYRDDVNKLITVNTPHSGSQAANLLTTVSSVFPGFKTIMSFLGNWTDANYGSVNGAVNDLRVQPFGAISLLNANSQSVNYHDVQVHAITSNFYLDTSLSSLSGDQPMLPLMVAAKFAKIGFQSFISSLYKNELNDGIVPLSSQQGGLGSPYVSYYGNIFHTSITNDPYVKNEVYGLLNEEPGATNFKNGGFDPPSLVSDYKMAPQIDGTASINTNTQLITFKNLKEGTVFHTGDTAQITITLDKTVSRFMLMMANKKIEGQSQAYSEDNFTLIDTFSNSSSFTYKYALPNGYFGPIGIAVMGYDSHGVLGYDTTYIVLRPSNNLAFIEDMKHSQVFDTLMLLPYMGKPMDFLGYFNGDGTILYNYGLLNKDQFKVTIDDTSIASFTSPNIFNGKKEGVTYATLAYGNQIDTNKLYIRVGKLDSNVKKHIVTGVNTADFNNKISNFTIYPNPYSMAMQHEALTISMDNRIHGKGRIYVTDIIGNTLFSNTITLSNGKGQLPMNDKTMAKGIYFIHLNINNQEQVSKLIVE